MSLARQKTQPSVKRVMVHVGQGDFAVSDDPSVVMMTVLGSCVATALHDPVARLGGLNHFLLPGMGAEDQNEMLHGVYVMELLINALLKRGAARHRLQAKVFGGARIVKGLSEIGGRNAEFVREFLDDEGIRCTASSLGGTRARRLRYWPADNRARQMLLTDTSALPPVQPPPPPIGDGNDVELF